MVASTVLGVSCVWAAGVFTPRVLGSQERPSPVLGGALLLLLLQAVSVCLSGQLEALSGMSHEIQIM